MTSTFTSVPRPTPGALLATARELLVVSFGDDGRAAALNTWPRGSHLAARWCEFSAARADAAALTRLRSMLATSTVGFRLLLAGPETDVYLARATALDCGALDEELTLVVTSADDRRVLCAHCKTLTETTEPIGGTVRCAGCDRLMLIYHHYSRRTASYLGFMVNAEDLA